MLKTIFNIIYELKENQNQNFQYKLYIPTVHG
jgi:hypothetical protein